jgi:energy-coupling factor transporter transmembrane protein EcfT
MERTTGWYSHVHPVFRIISFVIFSLILSLGGKAYVPVAGCAVLLLFISTGSGYLFAFWSMLRRMRWLLFSIFVIYAWLTPGEPFPALSYGGAWLPTQEGVIEGVRRMLALTLIVAAVQWLLWVTEREQLVAALYWLARPLQWCGLSRERFAVRMALILTYVVEVQMLVTRQVKEAGVAKGDIKGYATVVAEILHTVVEQAEQESCHEIEVDVADKPPAWQWLLPLLLAAVILLAGSFV